MYEIRQIIARLRLGESDRAIARTQRMGRATVASIRRVADPRPDATAPLGGNARRLLGLSSR